jgi:hypothetical protein
LSTCQDGPRYTFTPTDPVKYILYAYILSIDTMSFHTVDDSRLVISEAHPANNKTVAVVFTKYDAPNCLSAVGLHQLYFGHLWTTKGHIANPCSQSFAQSHHGPQVQSPHPVEATRLEGLARSRVDPTGHLCKSYHVWTPLHRTY